MEKINCVLTLMAVIDTIHTHPYTHMSFLSHMLKIIETVLLYITATNYRKSKSGNDRELRSQRFKAYDQHLSECRNMYLRYLRMRK